jgi:hypothetical protein
MAKRCDGYWGLRELLDSSSGLTQYLSGLASLGYVVVEAVA